MPPQDSSGSTKSHPPTQYGPRAPFFSAPPWVRSYKAKWLKRDLLAGITLAAYAIPVSLAYAVLAGLPPQVGIYCYLVGGLGYALLGSSRHLAVGPTSAISLIFAVALGHLANNDPSRLLQMASITTMMVAAVFALAWLLRLSVLVNFISESVLVGFKAGAALAIAMTQLPKLFGTPGGGDNFFSRLVTLIEQVSVINPVVLVLALTTMILLTIGDKLYPGRPVALAVVILSLLAVPVLNLQQYGITLVGLLPAGLPSLDLTRFKLIDFSVQEIREMARLAGACFLLSYIESISAARTFAIKHRYDIDARRELLALSTANLFSALFQGYPSAGGLSQSAVNEKAGARSPLALLFASLVLGLVLLYLTGLLRNLPQAVLAAVVLVAIRGLVNLKEVQHLWHVSRVDFYAALVAFLGVLVLGILDGVILALLASLLMLLKRSATPHVAFLGRIPGTSRFSDLARHPTNEFLPRALAFRVEAPILYFNVEHILRSVLEQVRNTALPLQVVVCDLSTSPYVDIAGARMLMRLHKELGARGIKFRVVEAHAEVRDILRGEGLEEHIGRISRGVAMADVLGEY